MATFEKKITNAVIFVFNENNNNNNFYVPRGTKKGILFPL